MGICKEHKHLTRVVAVVDHVGYLRCIKCHEDRPRDQGSEVRGNQYPHCEEVCDACGIIVKDVVY